MTQALTTAQNGSMEKIEQLLMQGDLAKLSAEDRVTYHNAVCDSLGLNPLTRPFEYVTLNGKLVLYARKDAADQLRKVNGISITGLERETTSDIHIVTARAVDRLGRTDESIGAVSIKGLTGEALANALMKAETKAKRRVTLSISGLGLLDETEADDASADMYEPPAPKPANQRPPRSSQRAPRTDVTEDGEVIDGEAEVFRGPLWTSKALSAALEAATISMAHLAPVLGEAPTKDNTAQLIDAWFFANPGKTEKDLVAAAVQAQIDGAPQETPQAALMT